MSSKTCQHAITLCILFKEVDGGNMQGGEFSAEVVTPWCFLKWHTILTSATEAPQPPFRSGGPEAAAPVWGVSDVVATWRCLVLSQRETSSSERTSNVIKRKTLVLHEKKQQDTHRAFTCAGNETAVTVMNISAFMLWFLRLLNLFFCPFLSMFYSENILLSKYSLFFS